MCLLSNMGVAHYMYILYIKVLRNKFSMKIIFCLLKKCNIMLQTFGSGWQGFRLPAQRFAGRSFKTETMAIIQTDDSISDADYLTSDKNGIKTAMLPMPEFQKLNHKSL